MMKRVRGSWEVTRTEVTKTRSLLRSSNDKMALTITHLSFEIEVFRMNLGNLINFVLVICIFFSFCLVSQRHRLCC